MKTLTRSLFLRGLMVSATSLDKRVVKRRQLVFEYLFSDKVNQISTVIVETSINVKINWTFSQVMFPP